MHTFAGIRTINASQAVLTLIWSADLKILARQNVIYEVRNPISWVMVVLSAIILPGFAVLVGWTSVPGILIIFVLCTTLGILARYDSIHYNLRNYFPDPTAVRQSALTVDSTGIWEVKGRTVKEHPWVTVRNAQEKKGIILIRFRGEDRLIPNYAFQTFDDARAFAATINALRRGIPEPKYDWSAYVPAEPTSDGVWPPPI